MSRKPTGFRRLVVHSRKDVGLMVAQPQKRQITIEERIRKAWGVDITQSGSASPKLKKDGTEKLTHYTPSQNPAKEKDPYSLDNAQKLIQYFLDNKKYIHYLCMIMQANSARRNSDVLQLRWSSLYNPNGTFREYMVGIKEKKTSKIAVPYINQAIKDGVELYAKKVNINPMEHYNELLFTQYTGRYKGRVMSYEGFQKQLRLAKEKGIINMEIGTHSHRKFFGALNKSTNNNDYDNMQVIQDIYGHSSEQVTKRYIGLTKEKAKKYYETVGSAFNNLDIRVEEQE